MNVLLVGLTDATAEMLRLCLPEHRYTVAPTGADGLRAVTAERPDLLICGCCLPDGKAADLARRLPSGLGLVVLSYDAECTERLRRGEVVTMPLEWARLERAIERAAGVLA